MKAILGEPHQDLKLVSQFQSKSIDWFLYDRYLSYERVNESLIKL